MFGGGPLPPAIGAKLVEAGVPIVSVYGGTEFGSPTKIWDETPGSIAPSKPDENWAWLQFSNAATVRMIPQGDGTYELVVIVSPHSSAIRHIYNRCEGKQRLQIGRTQCSG